MQWNKSCCSALDVGRANVLYSQCCNTVILLIYFFFNRQPSCSTEINNYFGIHPVNWRQQLSYQRNVADFTHSVFQCPISFYHNVPVSSCDRSLSKRPSANCVGVCLIHQKSNYIYRVGRDSSVSITTRYGMDGPGIQSRWE